MGLPRRQRRLLKTIDNQMQTADPHLAWLFGLFGGLWADQPLPVHEELHTWASEFWSGLWETFAAGIWPAQPITDPPVNGAAGGPGAGRGALLGSSDQERQADDRSARNRWDDHRRTS